jgi:cleavage and polyadenylation specificity factor subunit 3
MRRRYEYPLDRFVSHMPQSRNWERKIAEGPPCIVLASPGFMQTGTSRQFLEMWAPDPRNGLIVTGYSVEGTMARVGIPSNLLRFVNC